METASDYVKDDKASFYGFKCYAIGYEFSPGPDEVRMNYHLTLLRNIVFLRSAIDINLLPITKNTGMYFELKHII